MRLECANCITMEIYPNIEPKTKKDELKFRFPCAHFMGRIAMRKSARTKCLAKLNA